MKIVWVCYTLTIEIIINIILVSCFLKQKARNHQQKETIRNLKDYNETLNDLYDGVRGFKHDFVNFIQALEGYLQCNDIEGIRAMTKAVCFECKSVCNMEVLDPHLIDEPGIYSLLMRKYQLACQNKIAMNIDVNYPLKDLSMDKYHFCRVLGILLDNALEAAKFCDRKIINISFLQQDQCKIVIIENSYSPCSTDWSHIYEKGFTTKKDSKEHGIGLWEVKSIIDGMENVEIKTNIGEMFRQELRIKTC